MKHLVDVARLEAAGTVTAEQASIIRRAAAAETVALAINVLVTLGAFAVAGGFLALGPSSVQVAVVGLGLTAAGALIQGYGGNRFGFFGQGLIIIGSLLAAGGLLLKCSGLAKPGSAFLFACPETEKWHGHMLLFLAVAVWLAAIGTVARSALLVALSVFALAGALGSSTGYWHASYALFVREATVTIVVFAVLAVLATTLAQYLPPAYPRLAALFALLCLLWVNFGFWVGSLWGDYVGESWVHANIWARGYNRQAYDAWIAWRAQALHIPRDVFTVLWALGLLGAGAWAAARNQRGWVNMVAVFAGIHFYTQWFHRLAATPAMVLATGLSAVAIAFALWWYNQSRASI